MWLGFRPKMCRRLLYVVEETIVRWNDTEISIQSDLALIPSLFRAH